MDLQLGDAQKTALIPLAIRANKEDACNHCNLRKCEADL